MQKIYYWIANKELPEGFEERFNEANGEGVSNIASVIAENSSRFFNLKDYYSTYLNYRLTPMFLEGMNLFITKLKTLQ